MRTFKDFLKEDKMAERLGKMSDAEFEQFLKGRSPQEVKNFTAKRATYTSSGTAGQGVRDAQQTARNAQQSGGSKPPSTPRPGAAPRPGAGGLRNVGGLRNAAGRVLGGGLAAGLEYKGRRDQGQSQVQSAGGALSGWGGFAAGSSVAAKALAPIAALPIPPDPA